MNLENKTAIVTGGSRGIGKTIALQLASVGANVVVNYNHSAETAKEVADKIQSMGKEALAIQADVGNQADVDYFIKEVLNQFENIDILVNNAGITRDHLLLRMKEKEWDEVLNTNLKGAFLMTKAVIRKMMKNKSGKIINITSIVGVSGNAGQANYAAAKAGLIGFTKSVAKEVASRGIQVNAIAPGYIKTEMTDAVPENIQKDLLNMIPTKRIGNPRDIANMVTFLSSDLSDYITGQVIHIDGGMYM